MRLVLCILLFAAAAAAKMLTPVWMELGPDGQRLVRVVVEEGGECPTLKAGSGTLRLAVRQPVPANFKPACEAVVPPGTRRLKFGKMTMRIPKGSDRIAVIGDTGCRVKKDSIQACDDPEQWPFEQVAGRIAQSKPDLIVHVGDYLYRESACPDAVNGCQGPKGDNWPAWEADFFRPAAKALAAAPWAFARGNHESKKRACMGWFYYLDPRPFSGKCSDFSEPYVVTQGALRIGILDTAGATDDGKPHPEEAVEFAAQAAKLSGKVDWIADHHPVWLYNYSPESSNLIAVGGALAPAWEAAKPKDVRLLLSGHVHLFEFISFGSDRPNQLIAGDGGTQLDVKVNPGESAGVDSGVKVRAGELTPRFGFTDLHRGTDGWKLQLTDAHGNVIVTCDHADQPSASCAAPK